MKLSAYMALHKITDDDLGEALGCSRVHASRLRRGVCPPSMGLAAKIAKLTGGKVTPNDLVVAEPPKAAPSAEAVA